jgi:galactose mutarotase-like enzyme
MSTAAFPSFTIANDLAELTVIPQLGAKIVSLRNRHSGHEWMWRPRPFMRLFRNKPEAPFETGPLIGADECIPTVSPCFWQHELIPDHGELWSIPWQIDESLLAQNILGTCARFPVSPFTLQRQISLRRSEFVFDYKLISHSRQPQRFLWAFHPLLPITSDTVLDLHPAPSNVLVTAVTGLASITAGSLRPWPSPFPETCLERLQLGPQPAYIKLFADLSEHHRGCASIRQGRERLCFSFETAQVPFIGIWITRGGWNGYTHLSIEPTNAACDSLDRVPETNRTVVPPLGSIEWGFRMKLESS